jgi:HK97 family phage portal protein
VGRIRDFFLGPELEPGDDPDALFLGTKHRTSDLFESQVGDFWANLASVTGASNPTLINRVWVANRCMQLNSNAISTMPLRFYGGREPAWVANPDPVWFPNGIGDAVFAAVWSMYGWGDAFVYITDRYADGFASAWTVLNPETMVVETRGGERVYRSGQTLLNPRNMVQISRDPRGGVRGTSALSAYSSYANGMLAVADLGRVMMDSGIPSAVLKAQRKITEAQAAALQAQWVSAISQRRGAPAVLPPEVDFEQLAFSPKDLMLLEAQNFNAKVISSAFGVPSSMINMPPEGGLNYTTPVLLLEQWWRTELRPTAFRISRALSSQMLARGSYVEFDAREFLAPTMKEHAETWLALLEGGAASVEEVRAAVLGLPPATTPEEAVDALTVPPSAGASPSEQPGAVVALRPTGTVSQ